MLDSHVTATRRHGVLSTLLSTLLSTALSAAGALLLHYRTRRSITHLEHLDDHLLRDLGITRADLRAAAARSTLPDRH